MSKKFLYFAAFIFSASMFTSCDEDEPQTSNSTVEFSISGLEDLGADYVYEGWLIVNGSPVSTGTFSVDDNGGLSENSFSLSEDQVKDASTYVLTIEPSPDSDPAPSSVHVLAGDFSNNTANLTVAHPAALANDFTSAAGKYILATPTDGMMNNELSGIWFLDLSSGAPATGLSLPTLPEGWAYEGWAVIGGVPVSTGTFTSVDGEDDAAPYSGTMGGPPFPGEDFVANAPGNLSFPTNLAGGTAVISIEPVPDNSVAPFTLKPLVGQISNSAADHETFTMGQNLAFPTGQVNR